MISSIILKYILISILISLIFGALVLSNKITNKIKKGEFLRPYFFQLLSLFIFLVIWIFNKSKIEIFEVRRLVNWANVIIMLIAIIPTSVIACLSEKARTKKLLIDFIDGASIQLPTVNLPQNAVRFKEPESTGKINLVASLFIIPVVIIVGIVFYIKIYLGANIKFFDIFNIWGILLACLMIIPHEFLHAISFPKDAEVQVWYSPKSMMAFVYSTYPTSKLRFIWINLFPNIIFGFIPLIVWIFIPLKFSVISDIIISFATFSLSMGVGDFLNVYNATIQMPKNSITQLSGFHSYWYLP